ncbi:LuxR C-terminal-related transcriptional regulator [Streptomyces sp. NPDC088400]|uniref:LuxR C-terminal-related transcriptional regulator n=1 Tax=Streptomyces sp. NPDC088400 TaxID=3365861 RepID=UPI00380379AF
MVNYPVSNSGLVSEEIVPTQLQDRCTEQYRDIYWSLFEQSGICMANLDLELRVLEANRLFTQQFGRTSNNVHGKNICDFLHPSVQGKVKNEFIRLTDGQNPRFADQIVALGAKDSVFLGEMTGIAVRGSAGRVGTIMVLVKPEASETGPQMLVGRRKLFSPVHARILEGVAAGESTVQLAAKLFLSRGGVEYHVTSLLRKLKVTNRPALISKGYSMGVFAVGQWPPRVRPEYVSS